MNIGRKIYYDKITGQVIVDTGERSGDVRETTQEEDFLIYSELTIRNPESVGVIELEFGQSADDFTRGFLDHVDPDTLQLYFTYPDPTEPGGVTPPQLSLVEQLTLLQNENTELKLALTELAEAQEADKTEMQIALAELAEILTGGE